LYATYGLSDKLDVVMSLPYIAAEGNASRAIKQSYSNRSGVQDVSLLPILTTLENLAYVNGL
jgi:hypothetical protein